MIRATQLKIQAELATRFSLTETVVKNGIQTYRDILWTQPDVALRSRAEQSSLLGRDPESSFPFISFWRTGWRGNMQRSNTLLSESGTNTDENYTQRYTLKPIDLAFQVEYWTNKSSEFEAAVEYWYDWKMPGDYLLLQDTEGVSFELNLVLGDAQDNSRLQEQYQVGKIQRATFPLAVGSYIVGDQGTFTTIETVYWSLNDYSATGDIDDAVELKSGTVT